MKHRLYENFETLYTELVLPLKQLHPDWARLDGALGVGNRKIFGKFIFDNKVWKIHSDTHIERLTEAFELNSIQTPFRIAQTRNNKNFCLKINVPEDRTNLFIYFVKEISN